ncbi:MAG: hypothetical protein A4E37_00580 [Methanoregulaceae archaeon PtaB.Bin056]|nr:MAG: hypothetical protein A4E37_00580 [Methanoregulaceae archaeon PtaB.Bin056]
MKTSFRIMQERGFEGGEKGGKRRNLSSFPPVSEYQSGVSTVKCFLHFPHTASLDSL